MIKFYLKLQNNMLTKNLLLIISGLVIVLNIIIRIFPGSFIKMPNSSLNQFGYHNVIPTKLFTYCDVYLLMLFVILIFFLLGSDYRNSMEEITLACGASKANKFMLRKLLAILVLYSCLYIISFINIYTLYVNGLPKQYSLMPLTEILYSSLTANIFVISLSLFLVVLFKDIAVSTSIITAFYLVEEALWRCKITMTKGVLGHIYQYSDYKPGEMLKVKLCYILISAVLLFITYRLSQRKRRLRIS